jgi:hypothetical protein
MVSPEFAPGIRLTYGLEIQIPTTEINLSSIILSKTAKIMRLYRLYRLLSAGQVV